MPASRLIGVEAIRGVLAEPWILGLAPRHQSRAQWCARWRFRVLRSGTEAWNRRVKVETFSEELLGHVRSTEL